MIGIDTRTRFLRPRLDDPDDGWLRADRSLQLTKTGWGRVITRRRQATIESPGGDWVRQADGQEGGAGREGAPTGFETRVPFDQRLFNVNETRFNAFKAMLDSPVEPDDNLRKTLTASPPWEA